jgi:transglutaminase-like putative cysteine protease
MHYLIRHETVLEFPSAVREHHIEMRLTPRNDHHQQLLSRTVEVDPDAPLGNYTDYYGNLAEYFCVIPPHDRLVTRITSRVETLRQNPFDFDPVPPPEREGWLRQRLRSEPSLYDFVLHHSRVTPEAARLVDAIPSTIPSFRREEPLLDSLLELMAWVPTVLDYSPGSTDVHASLLDAVQNRAGVCQDFAHLFISVVRSWGVPARYVMGYLDPGLDGGSGETSTHAWAEVLVPGGGWIGFDATHNLLANDHYIAVALGRDSYDAAPQRGSFKGADPGSQPIVKLTVEQQQNQ